ncbi:MAG: lysophospholipid acyltransferase family protein [Bacteroidaceae bacterium]|nr:lysophospholipid acyltransferase family protein [Bacteroidaceae bacterium]
MDKFLFWILYSLIYIISLLPLCILYLITDICWIFMVCFPFLRYRKKIVRKNLAASFPEKDKHWLRMTEIKFYHNLTNNIAEIVKMFSISKRMMRKRMQFTNTEESVIKQFQAGRSVMVYIGHLGNWEWISSFPLWINRDHKCHVYHTLKNKVFDRLMYKLRGRFGSENIEMRHTLRTIIERRNEGKVFTIGTISDQVPIWSDIRHWITFLNQNTPVLSGNERFARKFGMAVVYMDCTKVRRGHYRIECKLLSEDASNCPEYQLTDTYFKLLEENIKRKPELWLWSHNRWKRTWEQYQLRMDAKREKQEQLKAKIVEQ